MNFRRGSPGDRGICVSGGGLRAASFGLGALQALQEERGLLRGEESARYLSAVSGGSYIAGAYTLLNCGDRIRPAGSEDGGHGGAPGVGEDAPFAPGSPEVEHLRRHCSYMVEDGGMTMSAILAGLMVLNLVAVVAIVAFAGAYIGIAAHSFGAMLPDLLDPAGGALWVQWTAAATCLGCILLVSRLLGGPKPPVKTGKRALAEYLVAAAVGLLCAHALVVRLVAIPVLSSPAWLIDNAVAVAVGLGALVAAIGLTALLGRRFRHVALLQRLVRLGTGLLTLRLVQAIGLLIVCWQAVWVYEHYQAGSSPLALLVIVFAIAGPKIVSRLVDRASPHHVYRDLLNRCFSVIRRPGGDAVRPLDPRAVRLSDLEPPARFGPNSFPELLICAAVNVSDVGATPAGSNALSLVFTPSEMTVPAVPDATLAIADLERLRRPTDLWRGWGLAVNLASAIAMTGAALSPAMGKRTRSDLRAFFATLNIRLGVWLPNPLNAEVREKIETREARIKVGTGELVRELFGLHSEDSDKIYVTDGGHYDNLGLVELLRRRCEEIWCIDASGDRPGRATALAEALLTASGELGVEVEIDLDAFERRPGSSVFAPDVKATHATGEIHYRDGSTGTLTVIKLGIAERTPPELREYRRTDRPFPYHSTINQVYRAERFDAYRALGWASTREALELGRSSGRSGPDRADEQAHLTGNHQGEQAEVERGADSDRQQWDGDAAGDRGGEQRGDAEAGARQQAEA